MGCHVPAWAVAAWACLCSCRRSDDPGLSLSQESIEKTKTKNNDYWVSENDDFPPKLVFLM